MRAVWFSSLENSLSSGTCSPHLENQDELSRAHVSVVGVPSWNEDTARVVDVRWLHCFTK